VTAHQSLPESPGAHVDSIVQHKPVFSNAVLVRSRRRFRNIPRWEIWNLPGITWQCFPLPYILAIFQVDESHCGGMSLLPASQTRLAVCNRYGTPVWASFLSSDPACSQQQARAAPVTRLSNRSLEPSKTSSPATFVVVLLTCAPVPPSSHAAFSCRGFPPASRPRKVTPCLGV
jgi:hypothetical protein